MEAKLDEFIKNSTVFQKNIQQLVTDTNATLFKLNGDLKKLSNDVVAIENKHNNLNNKVSTIDAKVTGQFTAMKNRLAEVEKSVQFTSTKYDDFKIVVDNNKIEHLSLKQQLDQVQHNLLMEKHGRNEDQQYFRSSFYLKVHGIPMQNGEGDSAGRPEDGEERRQVRETSSANNQVSLTILREVFQAAGITNFSTEQIDVCHRTGKYHFSPIIILFSKKQDRENVYRQRQKLNKLKIDELHLDYDDVAIHAWRVEQKKKIPTVDWDNVLPKIIIREHLTNMNNVLLKAALPIARQKNYRYPGYLSKGTIHVRKTEDSRPIAIRYHEDLEKIE